MGGLPTVAPGCFVGQAGLPGSLTRQLLRTSALGVSASLEVRAGVSSQVHELHSVCTP